MNPKEQKRIEFVYEFNRLLDKMLDKSLGDKMIVVKLDSGATTEISEDNLQEFA